MWLNGPSFLKQPRSDWHISENSVNEISSNDIELKKDAIVNVCSDEFLPPIERFCFYFSSWYKLKKCLGF